MKPFATRHYQLKSSQKNAWNFSHQIHFWSQKIVRKHYLFESEIRFEAKKVHD